MSISSKRRLSSNSGLLKMCDEENSDDDDLASVGLQEKSIYTFPKKNNARRRSSFGGMNSSKSPVNAQEQARITEMYKTVIQMSSENKLNEKNSWNYDLIDHMGKLIKDESRGVNFQKASCTLDASVKIYSNRVDDTYSSSHRILESLSRNGGSGNANEADEDEGGQENEEDGTEGPRKVKGKTSARLNIATTIERNLASLNAVKLENDYAVDPMFHKISKAFDEGGAKGMLMNNLRTSATGCSLSFHFADAPVEVPESSTFSSTFDMADLIQRSGITSKDLLDLSVCPSLDMYRDQMGLPAAADLLSSLSGVLSMTSTATHATTSAAGDDSDFPGASASGSAQAGLGTPGGKECGHGGADWEDSNGDNDFFDGGFGDDGGDEYDPGEHQARVSLASLPASTSAVGSPAKLRWADVDRPRQSLGAPATTENLRANPALAADMEVVVQGLDSITISNAGPSEYSYFDTNAIFSSSNAWAGARHWKYATRKRTAKESTETAEDTAPADAEGSGGEEVEIQGAKKKATKKTTKKTVTKKDKKETIDFSAELVDVSLFDLPAAKAKTDTTQQTAAAIAKLDAAASTLFLPPDAKVQVKDLCRLYLAPLVMIPANNQQRASLAQSAAAAKQRSGSSKIDKFLGGQSGSERVWGLSAPSTVQTAVRGAGVAPGAAASTYAGNYDHDSDGGDDGFGDYGGGDDDGYDGNEQSYQPSTGNGNGSAGSGAPVEQSGLGINQSQLLQADRKVEKIEIGYAKVSKRVNIQRLKADIWGNLRTHLPITGTGPAGEEEDTAVPDPVPAAVSKASAGKTQQQLSFQDMIADIASEGDEARQRDVTLPFYFICLLHLANEHSLKLEDREDMSDLIITMDQK